MKEKLVVCAFAAALVLLIHFLVSEAATVKPAVKVEAESCGCSGRYQIAAFGYGYTGQYLSTKVEGYYVLDTVTGKVIDSKREEK